MLISFAATHFLRLLQTYFSIKLDQLTSGIVSNTDNEVSSKRTLLQTREKIVQISNAFRSIFRCIAMLLVYTTLAMVDRFDRGNFDVCSQFRIINSIQFNPIQDEFPDYDNTDLRSEWKFSISKRYNASQLRKYTPAKADMNNGDSPGEMGNSY